MSGTSMDGVDASIIKSDGEKFVEVIDDVYLKYESKTKKNLQKITNLCSSKKKFKKLVKRVNNLERKITLDHYKACKLILSRNKNIKVKLIGFHGQTLLHKPKDGYSIQIGDAKLLAKLTKITVISNFRKNDILNGGNGAPLTPLYHKLILNLIKKKPPGAIINIGGISNITYVENKRNIISFDTGPGNCLIDKWVQLKSKKEFDNKGSFAKLGMLNSIVLNKFLKNPYYKKKNTKTLDIKDFNLKFLDGMTLNNGCATLSLLTVKTICGAIMKLKKKPKFIIFTGGGRKNNFIINAIKKRINTKLYLIDEFKFNGDFIESQAFAYLAIRSYCKKIISLPGTTGVNKPISGGIITKV